MHNFVKAIIVCCLLIIIGGCLYYTQQKGQGIREEEDIKELFQGETNPVSDLQGYSAYDPYTSAYDRGVGQGGGLDRKNGGGSLRDNPPTGRGCYVYSDGNCPRQKRRLQRRDPNHPLITRRWYRDWWGERYRNAKNDACRCLDRASAYNNWCGSSDYKAVFNGPTKNCSEKNLIPEGHLSTLVSSKFGKLKGPWISRNGIPVQAVVWDDVTKTGIALVHQSTGRPNNSYIKMAKFDSDGKPIRNSGRYYLSINVKKTDTITSLYEKGNDAGNNYEFVKDCKFCLSGQNDENYNPVDLSKVAEGYMEQIDELTEERNMFDASFNYFDSQFESMKEKMNDEIDTYKTQYDNCQTDLDLEKTKYTNDINAITKDHDDLRAENEAMEKELGKINEQLKIKDVEINELKGKLNIAQDCCYSKSSDLIEATKTIAEYQNESKNLSKINVNS